MCCCISLYNILLICHYLCGSSIDSWYCKNCIHACPSTVFLLGVNLSSQLLGTPLTSQSGLPWPPALCFKPSCRGDNYQEGLNVTSAKCVKISRLITEILSRAANYILFSCWEKGKQRTYKIKIGQGQWQRWSVAWLHLACAIPFKVLSANSIFIRCMCQSKIYIWCSRRTSIFFYTLLYLLQPGRSGIAICSCVWPKYLICGVDLNPNKSVTCDSGSFH